MLIKATFTGVDDRTQINELNEITDNYGLFDVEFGVLLFPWKQGMGKYPSQKMLAKLDNAQGLKMALHICGDKMFQEFIGGNLIKNNSSKDYLVYDRIQVNIPRTITERDAYIVDRFNSLLRNEYENYGVITQHNSHNEWLTQQITAENHCALFDKSGGNGILAKQWPSPLPNKICGYAGGLSPDNLAAELPKIHAAANGSDYWIDMETHIRTNDQFDTDKVKRCCDIIREFIRCVK